MRQRHVQSNPRSEVENIPPVNRAPSDASQKDEGQQDSARKERSRRNEGDDHETGCSATEGQFLPRILWLGRILGCLTFVYGFYLGQSQLCTHEECDMTYSMRMFLELDMPTTHQRPGYRLFKFIDQRDPRHKSFHRRQMPLQGSEWCLDATQTTVVLYVPGHGGSYQQSRSLGAHGVQLTAREDNFQTRRAVQAFRKSEWTGNATSLDSFVFDVYALDFDEEGAGLHGIFIEKQSDMVAESVNFLAQRCRFDHITIVAHSIGGYAARLALVEHPDLQSIVRNLITLGTPHSHPVLAMDLSLHRIHARLNRNALTSVTTVSISGGLRDEMIPPDLVASNPTLNLLASNIMYVGEKTPPLLGMDHRAIVWCHNLLSPLRRILFALSPFSSDANDNPSTKLLHVAEVLEIPRDYDYVVALRQMRLAAIEELGFWFASLSELGLLYRLETLFAIYSVMCALYYIFGTSSAVSLAAIAISPLFVVHSQTISCSWISLLVQSFAANTILQLCFLGAQMLCKQQMSTIQLVCVVWLIVAAPILSAGLFYAIAVHRLSVPSPDLLLAVLPLGMVLLVTRKVYSPTFCSNFVKALLLLMACTVPRQYPGAATLQCALLVPAFAFADFLLCMLIL